MTTKSAINFRTTYVLFGVVAVLLAGLAIYIWVSDDARKTVIAADIAAGFGRLRLELLP